MRRPRESSGLRLGEVPVDMNLWARALKQSVKKEVEVEVRSLVITTINEVFRAATDALINGETKPMLALPAPAMSAVGLKACGLCGERGHNIRRCPKNHNKKFRSPYGRDHRCRKCRMTKGRGHSPKCPFAEAVPLVINGKNTIPCYWCVLKWPSRISRGVHAWHAHRKNTRDIAKEAARRGDHNWMNDRSKERSHRTGTIVSVRPGVQAAAPGDKPQTQQGKPFVTSLGTMRDLLRSGKWQRFLKVFEGKCTCCQEPLGSQPIAIPPGMSRKASQLSRVKQLAYDFDTKGQEYLLKNYQVVCKGCTQANRDVPNDGRLTFFGRVAAFQRYETVFGRRCTECNKVPTDPRTFLIRGPEETPLERLKGFCLTLATDGEAAAKARYPAICRGCFSRMMRGPDGKIPKGVRANVA